MAHDVVRLMAYLGHERFAVAGHDRGALVAFRTAMDHPERVSQLVVMDGLEKHPDTLRIHPLRVNVRSHRLEKSTGGIGNGRSREQVKRAEIFERMVWVIPTVWRP